MECRDLLEEYATWLRENTHCEEISPGYWRVITPHQTPGGDLITLHLFDRGTEFVLTDRGGTLNQLRSRGIDVLGPRASRPRREWVDMVLESYQAEIKRGELVFHAQRDNLGQVVTSFIDAIHELLSLELTAKLRTKRFFKEEVRSFLLESNVHFIQDYRVQGRRASHTIDFAVNTRKTPALIQAASTGSRAYSTILAKLTTHAFLDLYKAGVAHTSLSLIDDEEDVWTQEALAILETGSDHVIGWSKRDHLLEVLRGGGE